MPSASWRSEAGLFFTGTDTGAGKTFVVSAVARALRAAGVPVRVSKPVATGATRVGDRWVSEDARALAEAAGDDERKVTPWVFPEPAAPPVAARLANVTLSLADLIAAVRGRQEAGTLLLVEGVGGLLCPLTPRETIADLVRELGLPLIVVARRSLGTLNHTLLTLEVARARGLPVAGVVVSETEPLEGVAVQTNIEELRQRIAVPLLAVVPHGMNPEQASQAVAGVDWQQLARQTASN